jgi:hypothetical protein
MLGWCTLCGASEPCNDKISLISLRFMQLMEKMVPSFKRTSGDVARSTVFTEHCVIQYPLLLFYLSSLLIHHQCRTAVRLCVTSVACVNTAIVIAVINGLFESLFYLVLDKVCLINMSHPNSHKLRAENMSALSPIHCHPLVTVLENI